MSDDQVLEQFLDKNDAGRRMLFAIPKTAGDVLICTSLLPSIKKLYPELNLYFATEPAYFSIVEDNPYIHKIIPFIPRMSQLFWLEGAYSHSGWFEIAFLPYIQTQMVFTYQHNRYNRFAFDLFEEELARSRDLLRCTI